jgi:hypothetical protein
MTVHNRQWVLVNSPPCPREIVEFQEPKAVNGDLLYHSAKMLFHQTKQFCSRTPHPRVPCFRLRCTIALLIPVRLAHCFAEFCGDRVSCSSTITEEAGLTAEQELPGLCTCKSCAEPSALNLSLMHATVNHVGVSNANSRRHSLCTCTHFQISITTSKLSFVARMTTVPPPFSLTFLPFDRMALAFVWLAPSFERISHYTLCITFL